MKELFTLYYHRRILFTDFFSQSRGEDKAALSKLDIKKTTGRICSNDSAGGFSKIS